jgi:DNA polymerase III subunit epsilon
MAGTALVEQHQRYFEDTWQDSDHVDTVRFVVLDSETTGLDPRKDRLITIGAVVVQNGEIILEDSFEALLKVAHNTSAVTVHGITRDDSLRGFDEPEALELFLPYLRDGVIVGHHIGHDVATFNAAYDRHFGFELTNRFLDTMDLTLHLERDGAFQDQEQIKSFTLDALCEMFDVIPHDRHTAPGDAFITAQVFLRLLNLARKVGRTELSRLAEPFPVEREGASGAQH